MMMKMTMIIKMRISKIICGTLLTSAVCPGNLMYTADNNLCDNDNEDDNDDEDDNGNDGEGEDDDEN